jgi:hypothetical protein
MVLQGDGIVSSVHRCAADPHVVYAATASGVLRSADRGATWGTPTAIGTHNITDLAVAPADCQDVYALAEDDGPHRSTDGAATFGPAQAQGFDSIPLEGRMRVAPGAAGNVLIAGHGGIFYSAAGGASWHLASGLLGIQANAMSVSPLDPSHVWLATWGSGVWHRPSPAQPWQRVAASALPVDYVFTVGADPFTAKRVLVGGFRTLYESADQASFPATSLTLNEFSIAFANDSAKSVYVTTQQGGVFKSTGASDAGAGTFAPANTGLGSVVDVRSIVVDPASSQTLYAGTNGHGVFKSTDGAGTWTSVLGPSQVTMCLAVVPGASGGVYACVQGGGVQRSGDSGATWADASQGLSTQDVSALLVDPQTGDLYASAGPLVYVKHGTQPWTPLDACSPGVVPSAPAIIANGTTRQLLVGAGGSVYAHAL